MTRSKFNEICADLFDKMIEPIDEVLRDARYNKQEIERVILAGGSTRMIRVHELLIEYFGNRKDILSKVQNPDECVSQGACILAGMYQKAPDLSRFEFTDVISHSLGVAISEIGEDDESKEKLHVVVEKNTAFPLHTPKRVTFCTGLDY